ncbi:putative late blight resistance protein homolog R1A-3 [Solanum stenotomum]|uniref:putative late blight resistance protein homolog R1A-3 n=1 Tax=Solanum stenotomum TaxID=172797 RepID=UPI0020D08E40|nr:putative late blight resistance protein homolog R1A-3 [Solanum stenotomum]
MEIGKENEGETEILASNSLVSSAVLRDDIVNLQDFIERLKKNEEDQIVDQTEKLTFLLACLQLCYYMSDGPNAEMSCISYEVHDLVQSLFHQSSGDDMMVKLTDHVIPRLLENITSSKIADHYHSESSATMTEDQLDELLDVLLVNLHYLPKVHAELIFPSMTQYELLQNAFGNLRDFYVLKVNGGVEYETIEYVLSPVLPQFQLMAETVGHFCFILLSCQLDKTDEKYDNELVVSQVNSNIVHLLLQIIPVSLDVMHICCTNLKASKSEEVGRLIKQLQEAYPDLLIEYLIHLQEHVTNVITPSTTSRNIHVMIEFLFIILYDVSKDIIHHDKLFLLLEVVEALIEELTILVRNLEEKTTSEDNMNVTSCAGLNLLENIELLKEDLKNVFLKARADLSPLCFPMSDGPLFMTFLLTNLKDLVDSNASSVALIKEEIKKVKEDLEIIRSFFGYVEQELHRDLWTRVLDVAYEAEHAINSILARDHGLLHLIFILPDTLEKIKVVKKEVQEKIPKSNGIVVANAPNKPVESKSPTVGKIIVGFEEETEWIIRKLTSGPAEIDVISIVGMPGLGKTTLAYRVYNDKSIVDHFDVCAWCTVDQESNEKKLLQKIFNQVIGLKERFNEDHDIDDDVADKLRRQLFGKRYLIVLDDMWDTATFDELTRPFPELQKGSRVILTSRKKEVALHGKCHSDPLYLRLLRSEESWELLEKRVFGEERCPDELKDVGKKISRKCDGLPLVLDLIGGIISRKEKKEALWLEVLNNLSSFIFKEEEEVVKVIQLSYDHLSDHVKPCLVYLASYPKDKEIVISELKDLWIAQGLVQQTEMKSAEEVVESYVDELISSNLVIPFFKFICKIHDLVHDFCYIKSRKEKLFDLIGGSNAPSSSSGMMARGITIRYDPRLFDLDENFVVFNPEKKNPYVKHLLSLKVYDGIKVCLSNTSHLKHLRLLKSLDLNGITLTDSLLNEIGMLVHLKHLIIQTKAKALPPSFSNLCNLEILVVNNLMGSCMLLSPCFWSLAKLRDVRMKICSFYDPYTNETTVLDEDSRLEKLRTLYKLYLPSLEDTEDIFKRFPKLQNLKVCIAQTGDCSAEKICFPRLDVLNELEELHLSASSDSFHEYTHGFPLNLKILKLKGLALTSDTLSRIARLPNLQALYLKDTIIGEGKEWNMEDVTFKDLKSLKLVNVSFSEWQVDAEESFPMLEMLHIRKCDELMDIPDSFGDIASLKLIFVLSSPQLKNSTFKIKEYVEEMTGEDKLGVCFQYRWS